MMNYEDFIYAKSDNCKNHGFDPVWMPDFLFPFQKSLVEWAILRGRCALFEDCGLGKTPQQLVWAENVYRKTKKPVLILAPLAVSIQTVSEAEKFNIDCVRSKDGKAKAGITITNYEKLSHFSSDDFSGVVCDESSILKSFDGSTCSAIIKFMRAVPYRLLCTATAAPNDYTELGTSSEAIGELGLVEMLNRFFRNDNNNSSLRRMYGEAPQWRLKGHAETPFWRWVCSWARACRKPSDLGFDDAGFALPDMSVNWHKITPVTPPDGCLFTLPALTLPEQRKEKRRTIDERCDMVADIVNNKTEQSVVWCQLNDESSMLREKIKSAVEVCGSSTEEHKENSFLDFAKGKIKCLITKPRIGALGMNWQNCNHVAYFPSHSYEQYYQAVRRCWRFGQKKNVTVDIVLTDGEVKIMHNLERKNKQASKMFDNLVCEMNNPEIVKKRITSSGKAVMPCWIK